MILVSSTLFKTQKLKVRVESFGEKERKVTIKERIKKKGKINSTAKQTSF